ncbi:MAG: hypothetical protein F4Z31_22785 [Gemmatimonadetes bacterium]|nr:hypothetical protein [Gemmatimonadota bacterium]
MTAGYLAGWLVMAGIGCFAVFGIADEYRWPPALIRASYVLVVLGSLVGASLLYAVKPLCGADLVAVCPECSEHWCLTRGAKAEPWPDYMTEPAP